VRLVRLSAFVTLSLSKGDVTGGYAGGGAGAPAGATL